MMRRFLSTTLLLGTMLLIVIVCAFFQKHNTETEISEETAVAKETEEPQETQEKETKKKILRTENQIRYTAKKYTDWFFEDHEKGGSPVTVNRSKDTFVVFRDDKKEVYNVPVYKEEVIFLNNKEYEGDEMYENAKKIALDYIEYSSYIKEEDRDGCKKAIEEAKLYLSDYDIKIDEEFFPLVLSDKNNIYIDQRYFESVDEFDYLKALLSAISDYTNSTESNLDEMVYRKSFINKQFNEILAINLYQQYYPSFEDEGGYEEVYPYILIDKCNDIFKGYFYSSSYQYIPENYEIPENQLELYFIIIDGWEWEDETINCLISNWYN